jgi:hypothetical protein
MLLVSALLVLQVLNSRQADIFIVLLSACLMVLNVSAQDASKVVNYNLVPVRGLPAALLVNMEGKLELFAGRISKLRAKF